MKRRELEQVGINRSAWSRAVARVKKAEAEYDRVYAASSAADDATVAECPDRRDFFDRYKLGWGARRESNIRAATMALAIERAKGRLLSDVEAHQLNTDAASVVDEFEAWGRRRDEAHKAHRVFEWEKLHDEACDKRHKAWDALLTVEAPDHAALLVKLDLLAEMEDDNNGRLARIRGDARRLLSGDVE